MLLGFYSSAASMIQRMDQQDVIANNLANVNTAGFKRKSVGFSSFSLGLQNAMQSGSTAHPGCVIPAMSIYEDKRQGAIQDTGVTANLALDGPGSFVVQTPAGDKLVRSGNFRLDNTGRLTDSDGSLVLGQKGPIQITGTNWSVDPDGNVECSGATVDKVRIEGGTDPSTSKASRVISGGLEASNVNVVEEMVSMISAMRAYETCQKSIQALDQTLDKAINQMGRSA